MRRDTFFGQVLTAFARSTPATTPVRAGTRPAPQLLTALARATPAFSPRRRHALDPGPEPESPESPPAGSAVPEAAAAPATRVVIDPYQPPRRPRRESFRRGLAVASAGFAVPVLLLAGVAIGRYALSPASSHALSAGREPKPKPAPVSLLMAGLIVTNNSSDARGLLPPSTCTQDNPNEVTCTAPATGITGAVFQTYPSLKTLYRAYTAKVATLNDGRFRQNFNDCELGQTYGEVGWNHQFQHTKAYTVGQMASGRVTDNQVAGRVFCNYTRGLQFMVWTQDDGHLLASVAGPAPGDVWNWWVAVHHNIGLGGAPMNLNVPSGG